MNRDRQSQAMQTLQAAVSAFNDGDRARCSDELARLSNATKVSPTDPTLLNLRGHGDALTGMCWMRSADTLKALAAFTSASDILLALPAAPEAISLADAIGSPSNDLYRLLTGAGNQSRLDGRTLFESLLASFIGKLASQTQPASTALHDKLAQLAPPAPEHVRLLLGWLAFSCGLVATDEQRSSEALRFYIHAARMIEGLRDCPDESLPLATMIFPAMEFERKRFGDLKGSERAKQRCVDFMMRMGAAPEALAAMRDVWERRSKLSEALEFGDWRTAREVATSLGNEAGPGVAADVAKAIAAHSQGDRETALNLMESAGGPGRHMARLIRAADRPPGDAQAIATLISLTFLPDQQVAWRAAIHLGVALELPPARCPLLAILFGKLGMRALECLRHELAQQHFKLMDPLHDDLTIRAAEHLKEQLLACGRLGEALRQADLIETRQSLLPPPKQADLQMLVEASCPLTVVERRVVERLRTAFLEETIAPSLAWIDQLETQLAGATKVIGHVLQEDDASLPDGAMLLSIGLAGDSYKATLTGRFGTRTEVLRMPPSRLSTIAFDALRALSTSNTNPLPALQALYEVVIAPFWSTIKHGRARVLVVHAGGALRRLPFGVLHDGNHYLLEHIALVTHPGSKPLSLNRGVGRPIHAAIVAVSTAPGADDLPSAIYDADVLAETLSRNKLGHVSMLTDGAVDAERLESLLRQRPSIVHLSCHFAANQADAGRSAFLLGDGSHFTLTRLAQLDLSSVDLALLLGCGTQSVSEAEGSLGIHAVDSLLLRMGVGAVLGSAWRVGDSGVHGILRRFATAVFEQGLDLASGLREAVLAAARDPATGTLPHPHSWGYLVLSGDWTGLKAEM